VIKWNRVVSEGPRTPWRDARTGQTTTQAGGPAISLREREGERGLVVSGWRHRERGLWAVACSGQPEMREDPVNDGGVVDRGDQFHAARAARTAQDIQVEGPAHQGRPRPVAGRGAAAAFGCGLQITLEACTIRRYVCQGDNHA